MNKTINDKLKDLYESKWQEFSTSLNIIINDESLKHKPANPLLLNHTDPIGFENSDIKVLIIGQENNGWEGLFYNDLDKIQTFYSKFYTGGRFPHRGPFRDHYNLIVSLIEKKYPNKKVSFLWNNVIKVGKASEKGTPPDHILNRVFDSFNVLEEELKILKPNIVIFLSGPYYDKYISKQIQIKKKEIVGYKNKELVELKIENIDHAFRTYHPNFLNRQGKAYYEQVYSIIIESL